MRWHSACPVSAGATPWHVDEAVSYLPAADPLLWQRVWRTRRLIGVLGPVDERRARPRPRRPHRLAATLLRHHHEQALNAARDVMSRRRSPVGTLLPLVAGRLSDPDPAQREQAAELLAATGRAAEP